MQADSLPAEPPEKPCLRLAPPKVNLSRGSENLEIKEVKRERARTGYGSGNHSIPWELWRSM